MLLDPGLQLISARLRRRLDSLVGRAVGRRPGDAGRADAARADPRRRARASPQRAGPTLVVGRPWRLPRIRAEGLFWQEGSITLLTSEPLVADRIAPLGCVQTAHRTALGAPHRRVAAIPGVRAGCHGRSVAGRAVRRPCRCSAPRRSNWAAKRPPPAWRPTSVPPRRRDLLLEADVARPWIIDAVESMPPGAVADWTLEPQTGRTPTAGDPVGQGAVAGQAAAVGDYGAATLLPRRCKSWGSIIWRRFVSAAPPTTNGWSPCGPPTPTP